MAVTELMPNVTSVQIRQNEIDSMIQYDDPWSEVRDAPGILKCHHISC